MVLNGAQPPQNSAQKRLAPSYPCPALKQDQMPWIGWNTLAACQQAVTLPTSGFGEIPHQPRKYRRVLAVCSRFWFLDFVSYRFRSMCCFYFWSPQVLNICICWTIAFFFKFPTPLKHWKNTFGSCALFTKQKKREKKRQKIWRKKTRLNIYLD